MKRNIAAWKILAMQEDLYGRQSEVQALLTLGSGTFSRMPTVVLWWAEAGTKRFVDSSTGSSRTR